jgi:hypothetical protein
MLIGYRVAANAEKKICVLHVENINHCGYVAAQIEYRSFRNYWVPNPNHAVVAARCDFKPLGVE